MENDWLSALEKLKQSGALPEGEQAGSDITDFDTNDSTEKSNRSAGILHILMEKKGRNGKTATIIEGFECDDAKLQGIARMLKQRIGTGGSARGGEILLQGDFRDKARDILKKEGFRTKG